MEPLRFIRSGIAASAIGHLSILTAVLIFTEAHPFGTVTAEPITAGSVQITGGGSTGFTQGQATSLADTLKYGSLPLDFKPLDENTISAQLAHSSLDAGLIAGTLGLALVAAYLFA